MMMVRSKKPSNATSAVGRDQKGGGRVISEHWVSWSNIAGATDLRDANLPRQFKVVSSPGKMTLFAYHTREGRRLTSLTDIAL
jgi:hypothetical protein